MSADRASEAPFQAAGTGDVRCLTCGEQISTSSPFADRIRRVDGASVPRDLTTVTEVHCPICGAMGSIVLDDGATEAVLVVDLRREPHP